MVDYVKLQATAKRLVEENGRTVTFVQLEETPADAAKPWDGAADPRTPPNASLATPAVFVEPSSAVALGIATRDSELVKRSKKIMIVAPGDATDLAIYDEVIDEGETWKIMMVEQLKPASTSLLFFVGVSK